MMNESISISMLGVRKMHVLLQINVLGFIKKKEKKTLLTS